MEFGFENSTIYHFVLKIVILPQISNILDADDDDLQLKTFIQFP